MLLARVLSAFVVLVGLTGCYPAALNSHAPPPAEQPQALHDAYLPTTASVPPLPRTLPRCTVCNPTSTNVYVGWSP